MQELNEILRQSELKKKEAQKSITRYLERNDSLAINLIGVAKDELNCQIRLAHKNQVEIDKLLQDNIILQKRLAKNQNRWIQNYDQLLSGLKQVGDLVNWS